MDFPQEASSLPQGGSPVPDKRKQSPKQIVQGCLVIIVLGAVVVGACTGIVFACTNGDSEEPKTVREQIEDCQPVGRAP